MKSTIQRALLAVAVATLGAGAVGTASAQTPSSAPAATTGQGAHHRHHRMGFGGSPFLGTFLRALHQLNAVPGAALSNTQQGVIKSVLQGARQSRAHGQRPDLSIIGNPNNSSAYAAAVQAAETAASARVNRESTLASQLYGELALTATQQTALQTILTSMQAKQQARQARWAAKHGSGNG